MTITRITITVLLLSLLASGETLTMLTELTSKMPTGTVFKARDSAGRIYSGYIVTRHARRMLRNGEMMLVFDQPVRLVNRDSEGQIHGKPSKKRLALQIGAASLLGKLVDDSVDGMIGPGKARYVGLGLAVSAAVLQKGSEAKLRAGDLIEVEQDRH